MDPQASDLTDSGPGNTSKQRFGTTRGEQFFEATSYPLQRSPLQEQVHKYFAKGRYLCMHVTKTTM